MCKKESCDCNNKNLKKIVSNDSVELLENNIDTQTGFLHAEVVLCRSGIQPYYGKELGIMGTDALTQFNVLRHPDDVADLNSLQTYGNIAVTDEHPQERYHVLRPFLTR